MDDDDILVFDGQGCAKGVTLSAFSAVKSLDGESNDVEWLENYHHQFRCSFPFRATKCCKTMSSYNYDNLCSRSG